MELKDLCLKNQLERTFIKKEEHMNVSSPNILAALITASSMMAIPSDGIATRQMVETELLDLYGKAEDEQVLQLIGMSPSFVKTNIGFSVDFQDYSSAYVAYQAEKDTYDKIYEQISNRNKEHEINNGRSL